MARPSEFDKDDAIAKAIKVFARHGFEAASTSDLIEGMGIGRQSLYGAFGDKRRLFLAALRRYATDSIRQIREALVGKPPMQGLEAAMLVGLGSSKELESGCLGVGSIIEFSRTDADINALNDTAGETVIDAFAQQVREGMATGEIDPALDPVVAGQMLLVLRSGLKIAARGGANDVELGKITQLALRSLTKGIR